MLTTDSPSETYCTRLMHSCWFKVRASMNCLSYIPEQKRILVGSSSGYVTMWDSEDYTMVHNLPVHKYAITCMKWSHAGDMVLTGDVLGEVRYGTPALAPMHTVKAHQKAVRAVE